MIERWRQKFAHWGKNRPAFVVLGAREGARLAGEFDEILEQIRTARKRGVWKYYPVEEWLSLYRQNRRVGRLITRMMFPAGWCGASAEETYWIFKVVWPALRRLSREELLELLRQADVKKWHEMCAAAVTWVKGQFDRQLRECSDEETAEVGKVWDTIEMQFFIRVWAPCMILYGEYPSKLMRKARGGDLDAIDALVRLDKTAILDRKIAEDYSRSWAENRARFSRIKGAVSGEIPRLSGKKLKVKMAGAISRMYGDAGQKLTENDLRELFDGAAELKSEGKSIIDVDIPGGPEAFKKAVERARAECHLSPSEPGQKSGAEVSR